MEQMLGLMEAWGPTVAAVAVAGAASIAIAVCQPLDRWRLRKIPGSWGLPLLGDVISIAGEDMTFFLERMHHKFVNCKAFKIWLGPYPLLIIRDPDVGKRILTKFTKRPTLDMLSFKTGLDKQIWSNTLLMLTGAKWRLGRRATEAAVMHPKALVAQVPAVAKVTIQLMEGMERYAATGEPFDAQVCTYAMAMDAVGWAAFGVELHASDKACQLAGGDVDAVVKLQMLAPGKSAPVQQKGTTTKDALAEKEWWLKYPVGTTEFGQRLVQSAVTCMRAYELSSATVYTSLNLFMPRLYPFWTLLSYVMPDAKLIKERQAMKGLSQGCKVMMDAWKQQQADKLAGKDTDNKESSVSDQGFLARLLSGKDFAHDDVLTDYEVMALAITAVVGGYDTTGTATAMSLYLMATNPDTQAKAQQEVDSVLKGKDMDLEDLERLPYINAVFLEGMRMASPGAGAIREITDEPYDLGDGTVVPMGSMIIVPLHTFHHSPEFWPRPTEFLPQRHLQPGNEDLAPTNPNAFMPFGIGPRMCVGYKFAALEARMALARLMQRFTFSTVPGAPAPSPHTGMTFSPDKVLLTVSRRDAKK